MAVDSSSVSKRSTSAKKRVPTTPGKEGSKPQECATPSSHAKRNKSPGIRMVGRRIYDSVNGKTCHQCRQKTLDFVAACKGERNNKPCPMMYCHKCLKNRYGEDAEKVTDSGDWICPRCQGTCNCSICMKKKGQQPTGVLINTAKATGFSSVSEMLIKGVELLNQEKAIGSPKKDLLPKMRGKENTFDGNVDAKLPNHVEDNSKEIKEEVIKTNTDDNTSLKTDAKCSTEHGTKEDGLCAPKKNQKKMKRNRSDEVNDSTKTTEENFKGGDPPGNEKKPKKSRKKAGDGSDEVNNTTKNNEEIMKEQKGDGPDKKSKKSRKKLTDKSAKVNNTTKTNQEILKDNGPHGDDKKPKKSRKKAVEKSDDVNNTTEINDGTLKSDVPPGDEKKPKKSRKKKSADELDEVNNTKKNNEEILTRDCLLGDEKKPKKSRKKARNDDGVKNDATLEQKTMPRKLKGTEMAKDHAVVDAEENVNKGKNIAAEGILEKGENADAANDGIFLKHLDAGFHAEIPLPEGEVLTNVAGIDFLAEDVGNALQFLEFCAVFGKVLDVKKGQAENVLQDIFQGRSARRGKFSVTIQIHINLLSILLKEQGEEHVTLSVSPGKNSWFNVLKGSLSESQSILKAHGLDSLEMVLDYDTLTQAAKLKLLNILCDEVLQTEKLRNWINDQNANFLDKVKEAKQKVAALKDKEKSLKQKMKDDVAQAILAKHGAPLTISEHEEIVSRIKHEVEQAQAEVLESQGLFSKIDKTSDVVRVEPMFIGSGGQAYWKLKCYGDYSTVLHQSTGNGDALTLDEKWFTIDDEGKKAVEKHICSSRGKRLRTVRRRHPNVTSTVIEAGSI